MTKSGFDLDEIERLLAAAEDSDLADGGRYLAETCEDLTRCRHGEIGEYVNAHNGEAIEALWNSRKAMIAEIRELRAENARLRESVVDLADNIDDWDGVSGITEAVIDTARAAAALKARGGVMGTCENCQKAPATVRYDGEDLCRPCADYCAFRDIEEGDMEPGFGEG